MRAAAFVGAAAVWYIATGLFSFQIAETPGVHRVTALSTILQQLFAFALACVLAPRDVLAALRKLRSQGLVWSSTVNDYAAVEHDSDAEATSPKSAMTARERTSHALRAVDESPPAMAPAAAAPQRLDAGLTMSAFKACVYVGVGHALGAYLTMVALVTAPIAVVQITKACEMVATVTVCSLLLGITVPTATKAALAVAVVGVVLFSLQPASLSETAVSHSRTVMVRDCARAALCACCLHGVGGDCAAPRWF
jgi:hypothetical protein